MELQVKMPTPMTEGRRQSRGGSSDSEGLDGWSKMGWPPKMRKMTRRSEGVTAKKLAPMLALSILPRETWLFKLEFGTLSLYWSQAPSIRKSRWSPGIRN